MNTQDDKTDELTKQEESRAAVELLVSDVDFKSIEERTNKRNMRRKMSRSDMEKVRFTFCRE